MISIHNWILTESQITSKYLKTLIGENEILKNEAAYFLKNYEDAFLDNYRHDLGFIKMESVPRFYEKYTYFT